ncbi:MAG: hypothetical protein ACYDCH_14545 [Gaiellaceae bacterium]
MIATNIAPMYNKTSPAAEFNHVRDLEFVRELLAERGATTAELREYDATIAHARRRAVRVQRVPVARISAAA